MHNLDLSISDISKIEGKASCDIKVREGQVEHVKFAIAEYKRFYTQALRGKDILALPQLSARICGTCSNAHLLCAIKAVEQAVGLVPSEQTLILRKLLNFGLIIRDHALHLYVFVLPDLFGKDSILDFDENDPEEHKWLDATFKVKAAGNNLSKCVAGRAVHAPFANVGGFTQLPKMEELKKSLAELKETRETVLELIDLFAQKDFSLVMDKLEFAALIDKDYTFLDGDVLRSDGSIIPYEKYGENLWQVPAPYSHASRYTFAGEVYMVGALARLNLAKDRLHPKTRRDSEKYLRCFPSHNIFHNNLAQAIEILHAIDCGVDIISNLKIVEEKLFPLIRRKGVGVGVIEAPRGALFYKLEIDTNGKVENSQIVVPTGQNQICVEESIKTYLIKNMEKLSDKEIVEHEVEKIVRAFDPCMSCASHFLKVKWIGGGET